jgi:hypothetical protein
MHRGYRDCWNFFIGINCLRDLGIGHVGVGLEWVWVEWVWVEFLKFRVFRLGIDRVSRFNLVRVRIIHFGHIGV